MQKLRKYQYKQDKNIENQAYEKSWKKRVQLIVMKIYLPVDFNNFEIMKHPMVYSHTWKYLCQAHNNADQAAQLYKLLQVGNVATYMEMILLPDGLIDRNCVGH